MTDSFFPGHPISHSRLLLAITGAVTLLVIAVVGLSLLLSTRNPAPDFQAFAAGPERKAAFFNYFLPIVQVRNAEIAATRQQILAWRTDPVDMSAGDKRELAEIAEFHGLSAFDLDDTAHWNTLLRRVDIVPPSLALAQAANESAWGTSRFARTGNNYYGQWCFEAGCGLVPEQRDSGKNHEVAAFSSPRESVEKYIYNLNHHNAYRPLREIRERQRRDGAIVSGLALAEGLSRYSERGDAYIDELQSMIRFNKLSQYDNDTVATD